MMTCNQIRETLALQSTSDNSAVQEHLAGCEACARYRRRRQTLDVVLRAELFWDAPAALSARAAGARRDSRAGAAASTTMVSAGAGPAAPRAGM